MGSHFKEKLYDPKTRPMGMFVKIPSLETVEIMASAGLDFIIIDMEHAPLGVETVYQMIVTAERSGMAALVRMRGHEAALANTFMDAGASGVFIPHCSPYEAAREIITEMVFPPAGRRGAGGGGRATQWGLDGPEEYKRGGNHGVIRVPMIEDPEAVEDIDRILGIEGIDAAFIGHGDLTQTLGDRDKAQEFGLRALAACVAKGIPAATTAYGEDVTTRLQQGYKWLAIQNDTGIFAKNVLDRVNAVKQMVEATV